LAGNLKPHFFSSRAAYPTPPASPKLPSEEQAAAAAIASQTLFSKLGSAFWEAFSGSPAHPSASRQWGAEKVRKVLDGSAIIKVIDVDHLHPRLQRRTSSCPLTDMLEESMQSLTLNKK
jgi:hypothetical protein